MSKLTPHERTFLRQILLRHFDLGELMDLTFELGVDYEMFPHATKPQFVRELIMWFERRDTLSCLVAGIISKRSSIRLGMPELTKLLSKLDSCSPRAKVQIIIPRDELENKPKLREALAELLNVETDEVHIIATAPGSIRLLIGLPSNTTKKLIDLELPYLLADQYLLASITLFQALPEAEQASWRKAIPSMPLFHRIVWRLADIIYNEVA